MGVFDKFKKKKEPIVRVAGGSTRSPGPSNWILTTASGARAMTATQHAEAFKYTKPSETKPTASKPMTIKVGKVFSSTTSRIPSYNKIPKFAKNYTRVPQRTFIRDLSDTNLNRTFGPATTGTPKAKDTGPIVKSRDPFQGLPPVNLPTITTSLKTPQVTASKPTLTTPQEVKTATKAPESKGAQGLPSFAETAVQGIKKALPVGGLIAAGATIGGIAFAGREARKVKDRRAAVSTMPPGSETDRRSKLDRRDPENQQTGTKAWRGKSYGDMRRQQADALAAVEKLKAAEGASSDDVGTDRAEDKKPLIRKGKIKTPVAAAVTPAVTPGKRKIKAIETPVAELPKVSTTPTVSVKGTPKTASAAVAMGKPIPAAEDIVAKNTARMAEIERQLAEKKPAATKRGRGRPRKISGTTETKPIPFAPLVSSEYALNIAKESAPDAAPSPAPEKKLRYYDKGGEFDQLREKKKPGRFRHPKKETAPTIASTQNEISKPANQETITEEGAIDHKRRAVRRKRAMAKKEFGVGVSQSLSQAKIEDNEARKKMIEDFAKKKGITKLPPAGEEVMMPERFAPPPSMEHPDPLIYGKRKIPQAASTVESAKVITTRERLLQEIATAKAERERLKRIHPEPTVTAGDMPPVKATAPPTVKVRRRKGLAPKPEINPEVVTRSGKLPAKAEPMKTEPTKGVTYGKRKLGGGKAGALGVAAIATGALMAASEAKADTGSYKAAAKAAAGSLYESGREMAKFTMGATIASKLPGVAGRVASFGLKRALPGLGTAMVAWDAGMAVKEGYGAFRAKAKKEREQKYSKEKYGSVAAATATRHAREKARGLR